MSGLNYEEQLQQVEIAIVSSSGHELEELINLRDTIKELLTLTDETTGVDAVTSENDKEDNLSKEYELFMTEIGKEEVDTDSVHNSLKICSNLKSLEGTKCKAPHIHQWGHTVYHNAMICSVHAENDDHDSIQVRVLFTNPTHQEMLPCPYYFEKDCKFSESQCRFSHGEVVLLSSLQDYEEPHFETVSVGSKVLAKQANNLWSRGTIRQIYDGKCVVKFESVKKDVEMNFDQILPLNGAEEDTSDELNSEDEIYNSDVINMSLMNKPTDQALGHWEQFTKGIGSKLMQKMGYIVGTGLGRKSDGRLEPVTAIILPAGKSLDHCMQLRDSAGGDKDLFNVERKLKRLQKKHEIRSQKALEKEEKKLDVFNFLNSKFSISNMNYTEIKSRHRNEIKKETCRNLNVASLQIDEDTRKIERELFVIRESLTRHKDVNSTINKNLNAKLIQKENELKSLQDHAQNIQKEQNIRSDKKKLTIF